MSWLCYDIQKFEKLQLLVFLKRNNIVILNEVKNPMSFQTDSSLRSE